jgi:hypothetical protein
MFQTANALNPLERAAVSLGSLFVSTLLSETGAFRVQARRDPSIFRSVLARSYRGRSYQEE